MSFIRPIKLYQRYGLEALRVVVPLTVHGTRGRRQSRFIFDTGCEVTMVSEDVATAMGLPAGGHTVNVSGLTGTGSGRLVDVRFRFPETMSGGPGLEVSSTWVVLGGRRNLALLGFQEVHRHFRVWTLEFDMYFIRWQ